MSCRLYQLVDLLLTLLGFLEELTSSFCAPRTAEISRGKCSSAEFQGTRGVSSQGCNEVEATLFFAKKAL